MRSIFVSKLRNLVLQSLCLFLLLGVFLFPAYAFGSTGFSPEALYTYGDPRNPNTRIAVQTEGSNTYLILPATGDPASVPLYLDGVSGTITAKGSKGTVAFRSGESINLDGICEPGAYSITLQAEGDPSEVGVEIVFSGNISSMYLCSEDPVNKGRAWVEGSWDKSNKATGSMVLQNEDGTVVYDGKLTQIKGRGNSTWGAPKKPYQIKLQTKTDLLESGSGDNSSKTWVLLANHYDPSLVRNTLALGLGKALGMQIAVENRFVDLYYDGEYRGTYLLSEKVEVGNGRVDITDLEEKNEGSNPGVDLESLAVKTDVTANGATYTYCSGMKSPEDLTGGFLLEMDFKVRAVEEVCYFYTTRENYIVVKSPEFASREEMNYIATRYQEYEDAVYNGGVHPDNGKSVTEYMDLDSMAKFYLINEFAKNRDAYKSSTYIYKDAGNDIMVMSPLWDYDLSLGAGGGTSLADDVSPAGVLVGNFEFPSMLCKNPEFFGRVKELWYRELAPLIQTVILGNENSVSGDGSLRSLAWYRKEIKASAACNALLWPDSRRSWSASMEYLLDYIEGRHDNLNLIFENWEPQTGGAINGNFLDVPNTAWYYEEVNQAREYGLVRGTGGAYYEPLSKATRAQIIQVLYNMNGCPEVSYDGRFSDVCQTDWYADAISWGAQNGIVEGYGDGICGPTDTITRQDLVVLLYRYSGSPAQSSDSMSSFLDAGNVADYAKDAMQWAISKGIVKGSDNFLYPLDGASRAEMAAILLRFYKELQ